MLSPDGSILKWKRSSSISMEKLVDFDYTCYLGEPMIHHVMTFLPRLDTVRISAVSKKFHAAWCSFPIVDYDINDWNLNFNFQRKTEPSMIFMKDVQRSIEGRRRLFGFRLEKLKIHDWVRDVFGRPRVYTRLAYSSEVLYAKSFLALIEKAVEKKVKVLDLCFGLLDFPLPLSILYWTSLTDLKLEGCSLVETEFSLDNLVGVVDLSIKYCGLREVKGLSGKLKNLEIENCRGLQEIDVSAINLEIFSFREAANPLRRCEVKIATCKSIKKLTLMKVEITQTWIRDHIPNFHLLHILELYGCSIIGYVNVKSSSLFQLELSNCYGFNSIDVVAPSLEILSCINDTQIEVNIGDSPLLKSITLTYAKINDDWITKHAGQLRDLKLKGSKLRELKTKAQNLETLELYDCNELKEVSIIDSPKVRSFVFQGGVETAIDISSTRLDARLSLKVPSWLTKSCVDYVWFGQLLEFLGSFGHCKKLTIICPIEKFLIFPKEVTENSLAPLYDLRHLRVEITQCSSYNSLQLITSSLWLAPCLFSLTIVHGSSEKLLEFEYDNHVVLEAKDDMCCHKWPYKCWRHRVKEIRVTNNVDDKHNLEMFFWRSAFRLNSIQFVNQSSTLDGDNKDFG